MSRISQGKTLISDTVIYGTFTILQRFLSFFMMPLYVNYLPKEDYGNITNLFAIIAVMMVFYSFGFENAFYRFYNEEGKKKVFSTAFSFVVLWGALLSLLFVLLNPAIYPFISEASNAKEMVLYASIVLFIDIVMLVPFASMRMERKTVKFSIYKFITILIAIAFNIYFIGYKGKGGEYAFLSQIIASLSGVAILLPIISKNLKLTFNKGLLKDMLKFGLPTVPSSAATLLLRSGDHILIPKLMDDGEEKLAEYAANYKLALPMMMFVTTFEYAWKPFYLSSYKNKDSKQFFSRILEIFVFICGIIFLFVGFFIDDLVQVQILGKTILPPDYYKGLIVIPFAMGGYFFLGLNNFFSMGLNIEKQTKYLPRAVGLAMIVNITANIIFIPIFGYIAAAWITLLSYMLAAGLLYFYSQQAYKINYNWMRISVVIASCLGLYAIGKSFSGNSLGSIIKIGLIAFLIVVGFVSRVIDINLLKSILSRNKKS